MLQPQISNCFHIKVLLFCILAMILHRLYGGAGSSESLLPGRVINMKYFEEKMITPAFILSLLKPKLFLLFELMLCPGSYFYGGQKAAVLISL